MSEYKRLLHWIEECAELTEAAEVRWCDGTEDEYRDLVRLMLEDGTLLPLSSDWPNCYLHRSDPKDVARVEHLTFICTPTEEEAGPNNNWMDPQEAKAKMRALFKGAHGRPHPLCGALLPRPHGRKAVALRRDADRQPLCGGEPAQDDPHRHRRQGRHRGRPPLRPRPPRQWPISTRTGASSCISPKRT